MEVCSIGCQISGLTKKKQFSFFPGLTADHTMFESQIDYFEDTTKVILQIMNENHVENIVGVGQSLGGYYIQALIARHPEKVKAFVGIGTSPYGEIYYSKSDIFWLKQVEWMGMCYPINSLKKAASKGATCTDAGYNNTMDMNRKLEIACPVPITYGEHDRTGKVRQYCKKWHEQTNYPLVVIKNAGHNANVDNPKEMNRVIEAFLKEVADEED